MRNCLNHRGFDGRWIVEHDWPKVLDVISEYAQENNITLAGLRNVTISGDIATGGKYA